MTGSLKVELSRAKYVTSQCQKVQRTNAAPCLKISHQISLFSRVTDVSRLFKECRLIKITKRNIEKRIDNSGYK